MKLAETRLVQEEVQMALNQRSSDDDNINNAIFTALKPVCDQLIININDKSVSNFTYVLETLPSKAIQTFQSYICFPIELQILRSSSNQQKQLLIDLLRKDVLIRSDIDSVDVLLRISILLFKQIASSDQTKVAEVSEELKLSVALCLTQLWKSVTSSVLHDVYCKEKFPKISPVIYMLVQLARNEKCINLRVAALECLQVFCRVHNDASCDDAVLQSRVRDVVKLMFPGIMSCCLQVASEPATLNHKVTCANITLWSRVVVMMMDDTQSDAHADWLTETAQKLTPVTEAVLRAQTHSSWQVRRDLALAMHNLLSVCSKNLSGSVGSLVCGLIVLSEDEMTQVSTPAHEGLTQLSAVFLLDTGQPLLQLIESAFYSLLTRAPRIMQGTDERSQHICLRLLVGYLRLQGPTLPQVLDSGPFLNRLLITLSLVSRLDTSHITLLEDCSVREVETDVVIHEPWKRFMYLNTAEKLRRFHELCSVLRNFADLTVITHALLDLFDSNPELSKEVVQLLNSILGGGGEGSMSSKAELVTTLVSVYLQPSLWDLPVCIAPSGISVSQAQSNIVQVRKVVWPARRSLFLLWLVFIYSPHCKEGSMASKAELVPTLVGVYLQPSLWDLPVCIAPSGISVSQAQSNIVQPSLWDLPVCIAPSGISVSQAQSKEGSMSSKAELVTTLVSVYLQPSLWDLPVCIAPSGISVSQAQSNIVQISLLAEGLGLLAVAVGNDHFSGCLLKCLYPLLECAGSPLHTLAAAGLSAVQHVARVCGGGEVTQLVCANVDYLSHHITMRLRRAHQSPGVLSVLSVVMRYTTIQVLPSLQEIIEDVLAQSYDEFQEHNTNGFLRVFLTFVMCLRGWHHSQSSSAANVDKQTSTPSMSSSSPSLIAQLVDYRRLVYTAETLDDEDDTLPEGNINENMFTSDTRTEECEEEEGEVSKPVPPSVQLTVAVLQRTLHFLPSKDEQRQILVMDILREGVEVLASEENQLLPLVHKIWSPLVNRFQAATRPLVIHRAFLLLCTLASNSRDFIRARTLKQVLPALCKVLSHSADASILRDSGSAYRLTQQYKLQRALLSNLGQLAEDLQLQEREVHQLLIAASPYLSIRQPLPLQDCCMGLFKQVGTSYTDLVWLQLVELWYPTTCLTPPSSSNLQTIQVDTNCDETSEFRKNVSELLAYFESQVVMNS
ncbi:TELO2-interacting protein 1 homolog [Macrosteles quadrilineatus]|uniref:TELO2-interacting protein 1 homolog n=1 Tax=Macrosteles quadrilineatus TaxID=74068 RepID=UPI0023E2706F|nr:TELO2-interacting protein 1 homolog [Macrosteles quadrilineatus]